jgi:hypothetical protein
MGGGKNKEKGESEREKKSYHIYLLYLASHKNSLIDLIGSS